MSICRIVANIKEADGSHHLEEITVEHPSIAHAFSQGQAVLDNQGNIDSKIDGAWGYIIKE